MRQIKTLYLLKTNDKSPYTRVPDSNVFNTIILDNNNIQEIETISLNTIEYTFEECANIGFEYTVSPGRENYLPYEGFSGFYSYIFLRLMCSGKSLWPAVINNSSRFTLSTFALCQRFTIRRWLLSPAASSCNTVFINIASSIGPISGLTTTHK